MAIPSYLPTRSMQNNELEEEGGLVCEELQAHEDDADPASVAKKQRQHSWVVDSESDGYFTLVSGMSYNNCKVMIKPRWLCPTPEGMGTALPRSKNVVVFRVDVTRSEPFISFLRSFGGRDMVARSRGNTGTTTKWNVCGKTFASLVLPAAARGRPQPMHRSVRGPLLFLKEDICVSLCSHWRKA